jgi:hypothetical protein
VTGFAAWPTRLESVRAGLLLVIPDLVNLDLPALAAAAGYPGTRVIPAASWLLSLLALKLTRTRRVSHVDDLLADPAAALLAGLTPRRSRARPAALVLHEMQGHPERRLRRREDRADLVGLEFALQDDPSACQFRFGVFEVVDFISEMADDRGLAILELRHAETGSADLNQLQARFTEQQKLQVDVAAAKTLAISSAINGVARPGDGFADVAHDDCDVIQPK